MTGITAKRNSVSVPKTAASCGQAHLAAFRRIIKSGDNPLAAIPETVIIGDRGQNPLETNSAPQSFLSTITFINTLNLRNNDPRSICSHISNA